MAVDTKDKRGSAQNIPGTVLTEPTPDGSIGAGDRAQASYTYRGMFDPTGGPGATGSMMLLMCSD